MGRRRARLACPFLFFFGGVAARVFFFSDSCFLVQPRSDKRFCLAKSWGKLPSVQGQAGIHISFVSSFSFPGCLADFSASLYVVYVLQYIYYWKAKEEGWRARSAFKHLQIDEEFNIFEDCGSGWIDGPNKVHIPFLACGDLNGCDSDRSYPFPSSSEGGLYKSLDPVQPPIAPPYKTALELKKAPSHGCQR